MKLIEKGSINLEEVYWCSVWISTVYLIQLLHLNYWKTEKVHQLKKIKGATAKERKRAATKDIAGISLEDVKYFDLPIVEALRNLIVGVTFMKRKCRELGIPRWPHRKIKSLDSLIRNIQEEAKRQEQESEDAAVAVTKRKKMLEREEENIEGKPFMVIQSKTKKFKQDVFKRRHRNCTN